ncbi:EAL domain-containing protein [Fodinisporobacter ferrooxydans]|uniref:EAL domain-containing protein n=1 Tax=Fodinisporobacter ferrooxydans TaxID=2901836 RepID=A0ABY4CNB5_9BACL|nr:EAL domain-containing protein [Alicyclobacillaceae bacterium MYW30-H2]
MNIEPWYIVESKKKCKDLGIDPQGTPSFSTILSDSELRRKRVEYEEILSVIDFFAHKLLELMEGIPLLIITSDECGCILDMAGDAAIKNIINETGIKIGLIFKEEEAGTNSLSLALQYRKPIQLIGSNHYFKFLESSACYSVPFQYSDANDVLGTITIMTSIDQHNPFLLAMLCTLVDSIERELLLIKQNRKLHILNQIVIETTRNGIIITDKEGKVTEFNKFAEILTGVKKQDILQKTITDVEIGHFIIEVLKNGKEYENIELSINQENRHHEQIVCLFDSFPIYDKKSQLMGAFGQFRDITERHKAQNQINYLAYHDDLTGLPNRRFFIKHITDLLEHSENNKSTFAIMFLDLDRFKIINDNLGHNTGDILLQLVSERLKGCLSPNDVVARLGGDEFTILLKEITCISDAIYVADGIIKVFEKPFSVNDYEFYITTSIGISFYPHDGINAEMLMKHADIAMYRAKEQGKNNYVVYKPTKDNRGIEHLTLESSLRKALQNEEFVVFYQPQFDSKTGTIIGAEALVRWNHPIIGLIPPGKFIPIAEETGLIVSIGDWVLRTACGQNKKWQEQGFPPIKVAVNLSSRQFLKQDLVQNIENVLFESKLDPKYLELEITESMTINVNYAVEVLGRLKNLGIQISIDDFGTGYSNLYYLKIFSIDTLKIDQSFIRDMMTDNNNADIVATIISMAHTLGLDVIAEGVETKEQMDFLNTLGCYGIQGYLFAPPLPAEKFETLLRKPTTKSQAIEVNR